jgi:hypothetical protein
VTRAARNRRAYRDRVRTEVIVARLPVPRCPPRPVYRDTERRDFTRAIAARVLGKLRNEPPERIARKAWGDEGRLPLLTRAPVAPVAAPKKFATGCLISAVL